MKRFFPRPWLAGLLCALALPAWAAFTDNGDGNASGAQLGIGYERRIGAFAVGVEYIRTQLSDDEYRVRAQGPAPATNPFILQNPNGTDFRRSDDDFDLDSVRLTATYRF